ncbi:mitochondrial nicotinamide adenine dinucleotide transporter SLC25A51 [Lycorma delicatula]|uniref:mitochondrial nicotinamide adenine dinucleotide transporter SLC25A51 n=1 Tax=Lycorma delicatula TaxID=130591 RepID=UPI003F51146D
MMKNSNDQTHSVDIHNKHLSYKIIEKNMNNDDSNNNKFTESGNKENTTNYIGTNSCNLASLLAGECQISSSSKEFICGWTAAIINIGITFPINKIIFRQMLHNIRFVGAFKEIKSEGVLFLYRGILPPLLQKSISTSLMFGMYENIRKPLITANVPKPISNATASMLAGTIEALLTPFERIQTLLQDNFYHKQLRNTSHAVKIIYFDYGFKEYYRGLVPILLRNGPSNVFFFGLRDFCYERLPDSQLWYIKMSKQFLIGAFIGSFISCVFYPCNVLKVHVQSRLGGPYQGFIAAIKEMYIERNRSISGFYRGVSVNCTRSFISWGLINVSYEMLLKAFSD